MKWGWIVMGCLNAFVFLAGAVSGDFRLDSLTIAGLAFLLAASERQIEDLRREVRHLRDVPSRWSA